VHAKVRYLAFQLVVKVKQAHFGKPDDAEKAHFTSTSFVATLQFSSPQMMRSNLHASITPHLLASPSLLWIPMKSNRRREEPIIGTYIVSPHSSSRQTFGTRHQSIPGKPLELDTNTFQAWFEQHVADQVYKPHEACTSDIQDSLLAFLHQLDATKEGTAHGVEEYFIQFVRAICGWDQ
jgi:hypothetical protein